MSVNRLPQRVFTHFFNRKGQPDASRFRHFKDMNSERKKEKELLKKARKERRKKKKNALVICRDGKEFWTTQDQFWQWVRGKTIVKTGHNPLRGEFLAENLEYEVVISNTVLNLAYPNHLREVLSSRKYMN